MVTVALLQPAGLEGLRQQPVPSPSYLEVRRGLSLESGHLCSRLGSATCVTSSKSLPRPGPTPLICKMRGLKEMTSKASSNSDSSQNSAEASRRH